MRFRIVLVLLFAIAGAWYFQLMPMTWHDAIMNRVDPPPPLYKWTDAQGRVSYGTQPPAGRRAQRVHGNVSVLPATPVPAATSSPRAGDEDTRSLQERAMERAVDGATR